MSPKRLSKKISTLGTVQYDETHSSLEELTVDQKKARRAQYQNKLETLLEDANDDMGSQYDFTTEMMTEKRLFLNRNKSEKVHLKPK